MLTSKSNIATRVRCTVLLLTEAIEQLYYLFHVGKQTLHQQNRLSQRRLPVPSPLQITPKVAAIVIRSVAMLRSKAEQFIRASGKFGEITEVVFDDTVGQDHFASQVVFATVKRKLGDAKVVVKMQQDNELINEWMNCDAQFYNEALMYGQVLPLLQENELFPECYYGRATYGDKPADDCLIFEDLRSRGYRLTDERLFLDYEHTALALRSLGKFHALSYAAKQQNMKAFTDKVGLLKEVQYENEKRDETNKYWIPHMERGILPLAGRPEYKQVLENFAASLDDPFALMKALVAPEEPIAVLCHGDFCRNNILYKYEGTRPVDVKFFDLATARYCSPAIDLSFFIFLNVPSSIRRQRWDDLLTAYHEGLSTVPGTKVPSLEVIKVEMRRKAIYAYALNSFFIPMMMTEEKIEMEDFGMLTDAELEEMAKSTGGEEATTAIVEVLEDLILHKCL